MAPAKVFSSSLELGGRGAGEAVAGFWEGSVPRRPGGSTLIRTQSLSEGIFLDCQL